MVKWRVIGNPPRQDMTAVGVNQKWRFNLSQSYLDLLKKSLIRYFPDSYQPLAPRMGDSFLPLRLAYLIIRKVLGPDINLAERVNLELRGQGQDYCPTAGESMIGMKRLDNLQFCVTDLVSNQVKGDLIEEGVWRGGASIFMKAVLMVLGDKERRVYLGG